MSSGKNPLMLMMALSMPGAAHALGLGDIHVDSGLNERLAAEIDIVGATPLELAELRAGVANRETFLRYGADRPAFLSSTTFKVTQDSQGRPVLAVRSTESFTEPMVNFLVDLNWSHGELVRQYTLLLDPAGFASARAAPAAASGLAAASVPATSSVPTAPSVPALPNIPAAPAVALPLLDGKHSAAQPQLDPPAAQPKTARAESSDRKTTRMKVGAKATLRGIAWRVGERSESDLQRMMIAIFRANPDAFDGNINRLHLGAVLTIPSRAEADAITQADAKREIHAQMAAWHSPVRALGNASSEGKSAIGASASNAELNAGAAVAKTSDTPINAALGHRIQSMEQELTEMQGRLATEQEQLLGLKQAARDSAHEATGTPTFAATPSVAATPTLAATVAGTTVAAETRAAATTPAVATAPTVAETHTGTAATTAPATLTAVAAIPAAGAQPASTKPAQALNSSSHSPPTKTGHPGVAPLIAGFGTLAAVLAGLYLRFRRRRAPARHGTFGAGDAGTGPSDFVADPIPGLAQSDFAQGQAPHAAKEIAGASAPMRDDSNESVSLSESDFAEVFAHSDDQSPAQTSGAQEFDESTHPLLPVLSALKHAGRTDMTPNEPARPAAQDTTVNLHVDTVNMRTEATRLDYNLVDLDLTAQHVQMPSVLNEHAVIKERRTNLADVLKLAIEREPDRHDLRMKLLELYYAAAATNRQAFLETVQKFARDRDYLHTDQWDKIAFMGRQIASDNPMFTEAAADDDLADCA
jgi:pilus assembly protein FimV